MRNLLLGFALAGLFAAPALADVVTMVDGSKREGKVVRESDREVVLRITQGRLSAEITLKREEVRAIERGPTAAEQALAEVERRKAAVRDGNAAAWADLGRWLDAQPGFGRDAIEAWEKVVKLDPENAAARARLGHRKIDGKWLTEDEAMAAQGLVLSQGRWVKPEGRPATEPAPGARPASERVEDIRIALAEEIRKQRADEQAADSAKRLAEWQAEMLNRAAWAAAQQPPTATSVRSGGAVMGPYGYGYYGVTTSDGQFLPFVPANGQGVVYYSDGVWLGGNAPVILRSSSSTSTGCASYGWGFEYNDKHWKLRFGGGGH
ncbi:MAG TPA: hypothetical protein PK280_07900 [Planctomycetota bacterium]|nr:hypothetical protein [Planctomycetota bacterium]